MPRRVGYTSPKTTLSLPRIVVKTGQNRLWHEGAADEGDGIYHIMLAMAEAIRIKSQAIVARAKSHILPSFFLLVLPIDNSGVIEYYISFFLLQFTSRSSSDCKDKQTCIPHPLPSLRPCGRPESHTAL
ncbi:hypothetical protein WAI453_007679 [Rhynchosporium graminicola]